MFIGLSGSAAVGGIAVTTYEWHVSHFVESTSSRMLLGYSIHIASMK